MNPVGDLSERSSRSPSAAAARSAAAAVVGGASSAGPSQSGRLAWWPSPIGTSVARQLSICGGRQHARASSFACFASSAASLSALSSAAGNGFT